MANKRKILIVDDERLNICILENILKEKYDVVSVLNGSDALEVLKKRKNEFSAIFLDVIMPKMDGYQVLSIIRSDISMAHIPVIIVTCNEEEEYEIKALAMGASDYISKPYKPQIVLHRLANIINMSESMANLADAETDSVTGLYNRKAFYRKVDEALGEMEEADADIIAADIEKFKIFNSTYGWSEGDRALKTIAEKLREVFDSESIIGRGDADRFFVFTKRDNSIRRKLILLDGMIHDSDIAAKITMKYGVYHIDDRKLQVDLMCDRARMAVNSVKGQYDKNMCIYDDSFSAGLYKEKTITDYMETALREKQFCVYFQPKYDIKTEKIIGAESLVRWIHPKLGFISPGDFIPVFERNGFIKKLDKFVWEETCRFLSERLKAGKHIVPISVNVSRRDIYDEEITNFIISLVKKYDLKPEHLHLEITESLYTENADRIIEVLNCLKSKGYIIEMDDFGSGYSSLNMLSELPIDILKLDTKFIQKEQLNKHSDNVISSIIHMAKWMNMFIIAEGVETKEQLEFLRKRRCNYVQGYYFSKPIKESSFTELLDSSIENYEEEGLNGTSKVYIRKNSCEQEILVVDDMRMNREIIVDSLGSMNTMVEAENGEGAIEYMNDNHERIKAVITDIDMPVMDGIELLTNIRKEEMYDDIPVIVMSQFEEGIEEKVLSLGADAFIEKPYNSERLLQVLSNVVDLYMKKKERKLIENLAAYSEKAVKDNLTGLLNRSEYENRIDDFINNKNNTSGAFIIFDVDNFKVLNDRLGHLKGDETLQKIAGILKEVFDENCLVSRFGGDEFSAFVKNISKEELNHRMSDLCRKMSFNVDSISVSCSAGICSYPENGNNFMELYQNADIALLNSKNTDKDHYLFYEENMSTPSDTFLRNIDKLIDNIACGFLIFETENGNKYNLKHVNKEFCRIAGGTEKEVINKYNNNLFYGIAEEDKQKVISAVNESLEKRHDKTVIFGFTNLLNRRLNLKASISMEDGVDGIIRAYVTIYEKE